MSKISLGGAFFVGFIAIIFTLISSCRKDLDFETSSRALQFSKDTLFLDTIFTQSNSETYLLKVFNNSDQDISISDIHLNHRQNSPFRINVDGRGGFEFNQIALRAQDSLQIFVEIAMGDYTNDMIAEDEIVFPDSNQQIKLLALIEEAQYHYPADGEDYVEINGNATWNSNISHVIYGKVRVNSNASLTVNPGTKIYLHNYSGIEISNQAVLNLNGELGNEVLIRGYRHDARYDTLPKQWNEIKMLAGSQLNANYAILKGGINGFDLNNSSAEIHNTRIYNMASSGIFAKNTTVNASNVVISNAADACLNVEDGGNYTFYYSSFANDWPSPVSGISGVKLPAYLSNYITQNDTETQSALNATFANCIFYGAYANGVYLDEHDGADFNYSFNSCLIKNEDSSAINYLTAFGFNNTITENPNFVATIFSNNDLRLKTDPLSPAINAGNASYNSFAPRDIKGNLRDSSPNMGAFE